MINLKGGRGHTAPYQTCMVRVPVPVKNQVEELTEKYREFINEGGETLNPPQFSKAVYEISKLKLQIEELDAEVNSLHARNGDLNLEVQELQFQLNQLTNKPVDKLTGAELGRRLGYRDHSYVLRIKAKANFAEWSRSKDPDHIGWQYDPKSKLFQPVTNALE
jgi:FtsZ-binding cell division protein ZapB